MPETALSRNAAGKFNTSELSFDDFKKIVINDYRTGFESRQASLIGRKEVLTGKAKFGIFGDGKEVAQLAMAKAFKKGRLARWVLPRPNLYVCHRNEQTCQSFLHSCMLIPILKKILHQQAGK